jgi:Xaa-Pro aminopeptidase
MSKAVLRAFLLGCVFLQTVIGNPDDNAIYAARRGALMKKIGDSIAVLQGEPEPRAYTAFRQDNSFYYLTGVETPNARLLVDGARHQSILFLPERDQELERWEGKRLYPGTEARRVTGVDAVLESLQFSEELERRMGNRKCLYTPMSPFETAATSRDRAVRFQVNRRNDLWDGRPSREAAFEQNLQTQLKLATVKDLSPILDEMRRVKDSQEIERLRQAGRIGALGLKEAIRSSKPGMYEYQVAAMAKFVFLLHGSSGDSFLPIVGSGPNSCLLHYSDNTRKMEPGDVALIDYGAEYRYYQSDITRTFPVSGKFTEEQARVYQLVLDSQKAALERTKPGATFSDLDESVREVLNRRAYARFLSHSVGHYVGMSTHDVGNAVPFEPGVVITVEPGVYLQDQNLGIRIEDTVVVTKDGYEILTGDVPKEIAEIERLMTERGLAEAIRN